MILLSTSIWVTLIIQYQLNLPTAKEWWSIFINIYTHTIISNRTHIPMYTNVVIPSWITVAVMWCFTAADSISQYHTWRSVIRPQNPRHLSTGFDTLGDSNNTRFWWKIQNDFTTEKIIMFNKISLDLSSIWVSKWYQVALAEIL